MTEVAIKLSKDKLIEGMSTLSLREIKDIIDTLVQRELFRPRSARAIFRDASKSVKSKKLTSMIAEEAVQWGRAKRWL